MKDVVYEGDVEAGHVEEVAGQGVLLPGAGVGTDVQEGAEGQPGRDDRGGQGGVDVQGADPVIGSAFNKWEVGDADLESAVAHHDLLAGEACVFVAAEKIIAVGIVLV